jgi:hypothetical protein
MFDLTDPKSKDLGSELCSLALEPITHIKKKYRKCAPLLDSKEIKNPELLQVHRSSKKPKSD